VPLTVGEFERLRLVLSTFQDGSGWQKINGSTVVGFRQFERALAEIINGRADEGKAVFDVLANRTVNGKASVVGFSCKLKRALEDTAKRGTVYIEVSNAVSQFAKHLATVGLHDPTDYVANAAKAGQAVLDWIGLLHAADAQKRGFDLAGSIYLILLYDKTANNFQLFEFPANAFLNGQGVAWTAAASHLCGKLDGSVAIDYYWKAGQLKFYVPVALATWHSKVFQLEPLTAGAKTLLGRAGDMYQKLWVSAATLP